MVTRFDRVQISSVNDTLVGRIGKMKGRVNSRSTTVPEEETFKHVFENAKKGNEMAAVLLDEWQKYCMPKDNNEKQIIDMINRAASKIFK